MRSNDIGLNPPLVWYTPPTDGKGSGGPTDPKNRLPKGMEKAQQPTHPDLEPRPKPQRQPRQRQLISLARYLTPKDPPRSPDLSSFTDEVRVSYRRAYYEVGQGARAQAAADNFKITDVKLLRALTALEHHVTAVGPLNPTQIMRIGRRAVLEQGESVSSVSQRLGFVRPSEILYLRTAEIRLRFSVAESELLKGAPVEDVVARLKKEFAEEYGVALSDEDLKVLNEARYQGRQEPAAGQQTPDLTPPVEAAPSESRLLTPPVEAASSESRMLISLDSYFEQRPPPPMDLSGIPSRVRAKHVQAYALVGQEMPAQEAASMKGITDKTFLAILTALERHVAVEGPINPTEAMRAGLREVIEEGKSASEVAQRLKLRRSERLFLDGAEINRKFERAAGEVFEGAPVVEVAQRLRDDFAMRYGVALSENDLHFLREAEKKARHKDK